MLKLKHVIIVVMSDHLLIIKLATPLYVQILINLVSLNTNKNLEGDYS